MGSITCLSTAPKVGPSKWAASAATILPLDGVSVSRTCLRIVRKLFFGTITNCGACLGRLSSTNLTAYPKLPLTRAPQVSYLGLVGGFFAPTFPKYHGRCPPGAGTRLLEISVAIPNTKLLSTGSNVSPGSCCLNTKFATRNFPH